jgi:hypothetical protein
MVREAVVAKFCRYAARTLGEQRTLGAANALLAASGDRHWRDIVRGLTIQR